MNGTKVLVVATWSLLQFQADGKGRQKLDMVYTRGYEDLHVGCIAYYVYYTNLYKKPEPTPARSLVVDGKTWFWLFEIRTNTIYWHEYYVAKYFSKIVLCSSFCNICLVWVLFLQCWGCVAIYNKIQMNIFELILSDPFSYQQVSNDFSNHYSNWSVFKQNMKVLFSGTVQDTDQFIIKSR